MAGETTRPTENKSSQLTAALAHMMGRPAPSEPQATTSQDAAPTPRGILEALLFVGLSQESGADTLPIEVLAGSMRDVSHEEIRHEIEQLNAQYHEDGAPYRIVRSDSGYRMELLEEFESVRANYQGEVRAARLSPAAIETLAIVAYQQPVGGEQIETLRGSKSTSTLALLMRRGLIVSDEDDGGTTQYRTSNRLLQILGLERIDQLPQIAEHTG